MPPFPPAEINLSQSQEVLFIAAAVVVCLLVGLAAALLGRRSGRRAISQRLASLGTRLGLDPPEDEYNIETSLSYLEQVTGGAAQAVTESSSDAIRLRRSLDTLTQGVVLCDENGTVIYRNGRANALMVSRHGDALAAQAVTEVLEDAWHQGSAERTLDLYGPPRRTLQVRARQIDDGRRPLGVIALIEDVSERRRLEEIRRDFVANVSHELKTPMGALGLLAETLVSEPDPDVAQRLAGRIHNEAFRVSRIIDDLLDLSRIESEEAPPREPVLVNLVMADAIERVRATADQRGIEIVLHEPSPPVAVMGDRRQLVSAMHALLENAITYSYDNSKVVVTGTVQRTHSNLDHPSVGSSAVTSGEGRAWEAPANRGGARGARRRNAGLGETGGGGPGRGTDRPGRHRGASLHARDPRPVHGARRVRDLGRGGDRHHGTGTGIAGPTRRGGRRDGSAGDTRGGVAQLAHRGARQRAPVRAGPRHRDPRPGPRPHLRALLPGRPRPQPRHRRYRPRPLNSASRRQQPPGLGRRRVPRGRGIDLHPRPAHSGGARRMSKAGTSKAPGRKGGRAATGEGPVKVLLAEDEESFIEALMIGLSNEGFRVTVARDGSEALQLFEETAPDILLLDLMLPKLSGIDVCRTIRARSQVPIIMVTAKGTEIDTVVALEVGADDYVTKPYRLRELVARMRAVLRRTPGGPESADVAGAIEFGSDGAWESNGIKVDFDQRRVFVRGEEVHLRRKEFELLRLLVENSGRVLTRDVLIDRVWGTDYIGDTKTLDVHIKRLRSRIEADPSTPLLITTVRGVGYRFAAAS